jgi:hypothetical protein
MGGHIRVMFEQGPLSRRERPLGQKIFLSQLDGKLSFFIAVKLDLLQQCSLDFATKYYVSKGPMQSRTKHNSMAYVNAR